MARPLSSVAVTHGFRVSVAPRYMPEHSEPDESKWLFAYHIRIVNVSERPAKLLSREWHIINSRGEHREVKGDGVIGQQPTIEPGGSYSYTSLCPLDTPWGTMEGSYTLEAQGQTFDITIARFYLVSQPTTSSTSDA